MNAFLAELLLLCETSVATHASTVKMIQDDAKLPPAEQLFSNHDEFIAISRARESESELHLHRLKRLAKKHGVS